MKYLLFPLLLLATPAHAEFGFDNGIRKPQSVVVSGNSVIDKSEEEILDDLEDETLEADVQIPLDPEFPKGGPDMPKDPIDPFSKAPEVTKPKAVTKKVVKTHSPIQVQRTIADDRIDDFYVQGLIKQNFSITNPIE